MSISALIVDDEASARSRLRKLLAPYSFQLIEPDARDGLEALEAIRVHRPQVVFLDIQMPHLGGFEVSYAPGDRTGARFVDLVMISTAAVVG